ncbi:MAG: DUF885 family protein [Candidatus Hodarchaeales archaeon]|jgi:uncharacterized protein (DUF885 family)
MSEYVNRKLYIFLNLAFIIISTFACSSRSHLFKYKASVDSTLHANIQKYPEWATEIGFYGNGDKFQDISPVFFESEFNLKKERLEFLETIDTTGWDIDDQIDYIGSMAEYKYVVSSYIKDPWFNSRPDTYMEKCKNGILRLIYRKPDPSPERLLKALERIRKIPEFLSEAGENIEKYDKGPMLHMFLNSMQLMKVINETSLLLINYFPEMENDISSAREKAVSSIPQYGIALLDLHPEGEVDFRPLGKDYYDSMLLNGFMLDIGSDSIFTIAELIFVRSDSIIKQLKPKIEIDSLDSENQNDFSADNWDSVISKYHSEIDFVKNYLKSEQILNVPDEALELRIVQMPEWLKQTGENSNYYIAPPPLDSTESGIFYLFNSRPQYSHNDSSDRYMVEIRKDILNFILPGYHYRNFMTEREKSLSRKLENTSMFDGWNLYMEELLIDRGFWGDYYNVQYDFYKFLRLMALASMLEIELHANGITIDSAYNFVLNKLGEDASSYSKENIYSVTIYSAHNTSVLMGYYLFKDMLEKARAREGDNFDLREFHDKVLSEGRIPPTLIARKYGWE